MIMSMETIKIDDPRLDESFAFMFSLRKGDSVVLKSQESLRGKISDGVYVGEFPKHVAGDINPRGVTLYEVKLSDQSIQIVEEKELQKANS
jgi:hypothetical protein